MTHHKSYVFEITSLSIDALLEQVSFALQKRTELVARAKHPKMWAYTDHFNAKEKAPDAILKKRRALRKFFYCINLIFGIILFVPGLMDPKALFIPLVVGAFGIAVGIMGLFCKCGSSKNKFIKPAKVLLQGKNEIRSGENQIIFTENQMEVRSLKHGGTVVPYSEFECLVEAPDCFLMTYQDCVSVLQKKDLPAEELQSFCDFIASKVPFVSLCH